MPEVLRHRCFMLPPPPLHVLPCCLVLASLTRVQRVLVHPLLLRDAPQGHRQDYRGQLRLPVQRQGESDLPRLVSRCGLFSAISSSSLFLFFSISWRHFQDVLRCRVRSYPDSTAWFVAGRRGRWWIDRPERQTIRSSRSAVLLLMKSIRSTRLFSRSCL